MHSLLLLNIYAQLIFFLISQQLNCCERAVEDSVKHTIHLLAAGLVFKFSKTKYKFYSCTAWA